MMELSVYENNRSSNTDKISTSKQTGKVEGISETDRTPEMTPGSQPSGAGSACSRWTTICLGLLCLLLLVATGLCVMYGIQKDQLQTERDQLQASYFNLTEERNNLQTEKDLLLLERNQLQTERDQLRTRDSNLAVEKKQLIVIKDQQQARILHLESPCETGWKYFSYKCYIHKYETRSWTESRQVCQSLGADLVSINTEEEQIFISQWSTGGWIGLRRQNHAWTWVDNTELCRGYWLPGQPNSDLENCVVFLRHANPKTTWHDYSCDTKHYFMCEKNIQHY